MRDDWNRRQSGIEDAGGAGHAVCECGWHIGCPLCRAFAHAQEVCLEDAGASVRAGNRLRRPRVESRDRELPQRAGACHQGHGLVCAHVKRLGTGHGVWDLDKSLSDLAEAV